MCQFQTNDKSGEKERQKNNLRGLSTERKA